MKTILKTIQNIGLAVIACLIIPNVLLSQNLNIPLNVDGTTNATIDSYTIGGSYNYTLTPQTIEGDVTWEVVNIDDLEDAGLQMEINSTVFEALNSPFLVSPDGTAEILHFSVNAAANPIINETGHVIQLSVSDNDNTVNLNLTIPVIRQPVSVAFVFDRSGSMGSPPNGGSGTITRMDILQNAASLFINKLDAFKSDDDAVALTYFESTIDNPPPAFGSALTNINGNAANFIGDITAQSPGSATAMGDGLLAGKNKLSLAASGSKKFIFLFTDGEQNVGKQVNAAGTMAGPDPLNDAENSIQIVTIGTGGAAMGNPMTLLQHIAESNTPTGLTPRYFALQEEVDPTGNGNDFNAATAISNFFDEGFQSMLSGSSPQTVAVEQGIMPAGMPESKSFEINANINRILFELITSDQEPSMSIEKDGVPITEANTSLKYIYGPNNGTNSLLAVINLSDSLASGITSKGIWKVNLQSGTDGGKPYQIKAQVDDHRLDHTFELTADDFKVEDILNINTKVSYDNIPLEDANVSVLFFKPGEDLGDLLAKANVKLDIPGEGDIASVGYQKLLALIDQNPDLLELLKLQENVISLTHSGDGNYTGTFTDTGVSGLYQAIARISGTNDSIGNYQRIIRRTAYLRFGNPDPELSTQEYSSMGNTAQIQYIPKYSANNKIRFVGPGFAKGIKVEGADVSNVTTIDNGDGSYTINFDILNDNTNPDIEISLSGVKIYEGKASDFSQSKSIIDKLLDWLQNTFGIPSWLAILLLLLILLIIIWLIKKLKN